MLTSGRRYVIGAADLGRQPSVKFLLQQKEWKTSCQRARYIDTTASFGAATPLVRSICACSPRVTRLLVDARAEYDGRSTHG